ncbi:hypothetical protein [Clostridium formicaceticum]|uniref:Uncharacterized protein n=1 Tax=Clostridium formicaceticum TaxID=1497 RepID=A0AAC9RRX5_9CLOT|nr:hypothetical protein [Clostridium formicaceticum]AOY75390.1 hypothetical protein BJL90_05425 [Clostridium formicaceticum]ARE89845.1 hypothetical protein CLFO_43280 [Clostridium formicaceticum]
MNKITVNLDQFLNISLEECLNYTPYSQIESIVKSNTESIVKSIKTIKYKNLPDNEKLLVFLKSILLKITIHRNWIDMRDTYDLDQQYLYTVIKRYLYINYPELLDK